MRAPQGVSHHTRERRPQGDYGRRINSSMLGRGEHSLSTEELRVLQRIADRLTAEVQQFYHLQARRRESDAMFLARWRKAVRHA